MTDADSFHLRQAPPRMATHRPDYAREADALITPSDRPRTPAADILYGADAIAEFLFGDKRHRRKVYNLVDQSRLPVFRLGMSICARKSVLLAWIADQERGGFKP